MDIPLNIWLMHRHSQNIFKVTKIHKLHVEIVDLDDRRRGYANRDLLEHDLDLHRYTIDHKGEER